MSQMEPLSSVYHSTTLPTSRPTSASGSRLRGRSYLDNISYASLNPKRCCNVIIVVGGVLLIIAGLALVLYGALFYASLSQQQQQRSGSSRTGAGGYERPAVWRRRQQQMRTCRMLVWVGVPVALAGVLLLLVYLYRSGRCRYCPLCPGAHKRRRLRENFQQQCLEAGNISSSYARHPTTQLPLDEQDRLMQHATVGNTANNGGLHDTDSMLAGSSRPVIRAVQTTI